MADAKRLPPNLPNAEEYELGDGITIQELRALRALNLSKTTRAADAMHCVPWTRNGHFIVLEAPGALWVYRLGSSERRRLVKMLRERERWFEPLLEWWEGLVKVVAK